MNLGSNFMLIFLAFVAVLLVFVAWLFYKLSYPKQKKSENTVLNPQRSMKRWMPKFTLTNRQKKLIVLLLAAAWISADILRISIYHSWGRSYWWGSLCAHSIPAILFVGIFFWWYSERG